MRAKKPREANRGVAVVESINPEYQEPERFFTIDGAAQYCGGISPATIRLALTRREMRRFKAGKGRNSRTLIALSDLQRFVREA